MGNLFPKTKTNGISPRGKVSCLNREPKKPKVDRNFKRKVSTNDKGFESWNKAKSKLIDEEFNKRRRTFACINCGEIGHKLGECPKPKP